MKKSLFLALSPVFFPISASGAVVHQFTNTTPPGQKAVNHIDTQNATDWSSATSNGTTVANLSADPPVSGNRTGIGEVNGAVGTTGVGYLYSVSTTATQTFALTGTFASLNTTSASWLMGNSVNTISVRLLVQSGGNWFVSGGAFTTGATTLNQFNGTDTGGDLKSVSVNLTTASWNLYDLSTLTIGGSVPFLPSYDITGIGFHALHAAASTARFDNLTLVPEPALAGLLGIGMLTSLRRKRA